MTTTATATLLSTGLAAALFIIAALLMAGSAAANKIHHARPPPVSNSESVNITENDKVIIQGALNLEYLEADYFLRASFGYGLDKLAPGLLEGGPPPIGVQIANLEPYYTDIFMQIGLQEIGHVRRIKATIGAKYSFPRPVIDLSKDVWANVMDRAVGKKLNPPFDPFANSLNFLLTAFSIPYVGLTTYVGAGADIIGSAAKLVVSSLLAVEARQDAIIRTEVYCRKDKKVVPYGYTTA